MGAADPATVRRTVEAVWRIEAARVVAVVARLTGDVSLAEEIAQDALVVALEQWPRDGVPDDPGPWLLATARHRAIDQIRRRQNYAAKLRLVAGTVSESDDGGYGAVLDEGRIGDDLLRLIFTVCHPVLPAESRVALTLRLLGGLTTAEIARAFLVPEPTMAARITRAKKALGGVEFGLPPAAELGPRVASVLATVYLIFNEGYAATGGPAWVRPELADEALRLGRLLQGLLPREPEVHGLAALMELQASRLPARHDDAGRPVLLPDQDRRRWDRLLIRRGLAALERAGSLGGGTYTVQAEIAACHARARAHEETDWERVAALYEVLFHLRPSPVLRVNQAVAYGMAGDPARGLALVDAVAGERSLRDYPQLPAVRGDLLARLGRADEARSAFAAAAALTRNDAERALYAARAAGG
ncbi:RNA polymerase sigma factor [Asanoa siamensis]|uniref:RNA polymerase sigma factor n=1 Tax=Asanoa siamensis TaxID=926357 RepID=A0ABQ4CW02_9ACTN|nr:RNA polymerase sigma factor [Asanoa siamensis]